MVTTDQILRLQLMASERDTKWDLSPNDRAAITAILAAYEAHQDDRRRALKRADALTLDTQTCEEAVTALVSMVRVARARAERAETELGQWRADHDKSGAEGEVSPVASGT